MPPKALPSPALSKPVLFVIFVAAFLPRVWAVDWGMPLKHGHIDEAVVVFYSLHAAAGDLHLGGFHDYPAFFLYVLAVLFKAALLAGRLMGEAIPSSADLLDAYSRGDGMLPLLGLARLVNVFLGAAAAAAIGSIGAARWGAFAGLSAALLWAFDPLAARHAHYATVDMSAALLFFLASARIAAYWDGGSRRDGVWSALLIGLAAATKYHPGALVLFLLPAPLLRKQWGTAALLAAVTSLAFLAANPTTWLDPAAFAERFAHLFPKIIGGEARTPFLWPTLKGLAANAGLPALAAAAAGLALFVRSPSKGDKVLAGIAVFTLLFLGSWSVQSAHYALPLYPLLFLAAGRALSELSRWRPLLPSAALLLLLASALPRTISMLGTLSRPDTRLRALSWARETLPPGARLLRFAHTAEFTSRDPFVVKVDWENRRLAGGVPTLPTGDFDFLMYGTYVPADPVARSLAERFSLQMAFEEPAPDFPHHPSVYIYRVAKGGA